MLKTNAIKLLLILSCYRACKCFSATICFVHNFFVLYRQEKMEEKCFDIAEVVFLHILLPLLEICKYVFILIILKLEMAFTRQLKVFNNITAQSYSLVHCTYLYFSSFYLKTLLGAVKL